MTKKYPYQANANAPLATLTVGAATAEKQADGSWRVFSNGQQNGTIEPANGGWSATANGQTASFDNVKAAVKHIAAFA